ncbi:uncharacterized protein METZ01_LOCUS109542 [marine metagenome]|uniref:Uncharacterized protein n=1 Tax=marine metagenome TaxID=408172 RepID=A0A381WWQ6_9ZZZZ
MSRSINRAELSAYLLQSTWIGPLF